jgi:Kdo2-lipid IVA lauroyltransferase/acyltransferase
MSSLHPKYFWRWLGRVILERLCGRTSRMSPKGQARLARFIARVLWRFQKRRRAQILELMRACLVGQYSETELLQLRKDAYLNIGYTIAEFLRMGEMEATELEQTVRLEGEEYLRAGLDAGKGVILITAHFGNWELVGARLAHLCAPQELYVIAQPQNDTRLTQLVDQVRARHNVHVIARGSAARESLRVLRAGHVLAILIDIDMKEHGLVVDFLGRPASTTTAPAAFARRTGAMLLPIFDYRQPDGTHIGKFDAPVELQFTGDAERDLRENTQMLNNILSAHIRACPAQWMWGMNRWRSQTGSQS